MKNRDEIKSILENRVLLLDGSYGAEFIRRTGGKDIVPEKLNLDSNELVQELHREYVDAGADIILTNSFGATPIKLKDSGIEDHQETVRRAVQAARSGARDQTIVLGDIGPTGKLPYPLGDGDFDLFFENFRAAATVMIDEGVDGVILETFSDIQELKAAALAVRDISEDIFLVAMMTFDENGRTLTGTDPRNFAITFNDLDVDAVGINCSLGPQELVPIFQELSRYSNKLLVIEPNAGLPVMERGKTTYPVDPEEMAEYVETFWELGANIIGGCCGTGTDHIRAMRRALGERMPEIRHLEETVAVTCPTSITSLDGFTIIGERINPAGRKKLRSAMEKGDLELVMEEARIQVEGGAKILDMNFGLESSVPIEAMEKAVLSVAYNIGVPISLDVQTIEIMERLMKIYPGRPLVNSSSCAEDEISVKGGLLKKFGGMMILLLMGKKIPKDLQSRKRYLEEGLGLLHNMGISEDRILFDPIVLSFGAGNDPFDTLKGIQYLTETGRKSVIGLSNLSFGLPNRSFYNSAFLIMALEKGLTAAIMNPMGIPKELVESSLVLNGRMEIRVDHIEEEEDMVKALLNGNIDEALEIAKGFAERDGAIEALENYLKPAMDRVGSLYSSGKIFLPQMILAAQTARPCFEIIEEMLPDGESKEKFIIATVKGDIHDIGKNIAAAIIRSSGFDVIDLGKDVRKEIIVKAVREEGPIALGLSAMMTTTAGRIKEVADELMKEGIRIKVIAGGASLNEKVVKELGGDLYAKDPVQAIEFLRSLKK